MSRKTLVDTFILVISYFSNERAIYLSFSSEFKLDLNESIGIFIY